MFSSLLVRASSDKKSKACTEPIVAETVDLSFRTVAQVGCGSAKCTYSIPDREESLVLYVSSLIAHRDCVQQQLTVTSCKIVHRSPKANFTQNLSLSSLSSKEYPKLLPSLSSVKQQQARNLTELAGAIAAQDVVLHIGAAEAGVTLEVQLEFLVKFTLPGSVLQHNFTNKTLAKRFLYSATMATSLPIESVTPLHQCLEVGDFRGDLVNGPSVVHVQFQQDCPEPPCVTGFSLQLADGVPSGCCSLSYPSPAPAGTSTGHQPGSSLSCDGIMMLNSSLTADQFPVKSRTKKLHPSELVFVVDCSGSMSGSNIQSATDTLITCIKSLPSGSYFNVIAFGSNFRQLFHTSTEYNKRSVDRAIQFANQMQASLGGTELLDPLRWIFKQPRCGSLARQLFIITDGGVNNTQHVLHTVRKNRLVARCHTFGIGPEVCTELAKGIASISGGRCVLLKEGERLQTKVMEVLTESLLPYLTNSALSWSPPTGYSLTDSSPKSLGTLHTGSTHTAFAFLKHEGTSQPADVGHVTISGMSCDEHVSIDVGPVMLPPMSSGQATELACILDRVATWSKIQDLETNLTSGSRKNSENDVQEPLAKKIKLNGTTLNGRLIDSELCEELLDLSLSSGIPCLLTCFRGEGLVQQLYPHKPAPATAQSATTNHSKKMDAYNQKRLAHLQKMHRRNQRYSKRETPQPMSVSSIAKSTLTAVGSTLKTVAGSFGLSLPSTTQQNGHRIEDQVLYQSQRGSMLHWDEAKGKLVYPSYYRTNSSSTTQTKTPYVHSKPQANGHSTESSSDDEDFISDTDSNSSLDPDWEELRRPSELRPLIQMQLYSGAWPMLRAFSYAVGVPLEEVRKLLETGKRSSKEAQEDEENCNIWTTALAVACLEQYFLEFKPEWEIVAFKGTLWLQEHAQKETDLSCEEVARVARTLVSKWL